MKRNARARDAREMMRRRRRHPAREGDRVCAAREGEEGEASEGDSESKPAEGEASEGGDAEGGDS